MENKAQLITDNVQNLVANLLYYDRKEDEDLQVDDIEKAIKSGNISISEMVDLFELELRKNIKD